ncbi:MAG: AMP-binding protein, partial [bacterium]
AIEQQELSLRRLIRYIQDVVYPYHPYLRKKYKELGIDVRRLRTREDIANLPLVMKKDYREDPRAFILQPKFPGREEQIPYNTARIAPKWILKYLLQAVTNRPRDYANLYRPMPLIEGKIARRAALEWMPIHFHASAGTTGDPTPAVYTHYDITHIIPELAAKIFTEPPEVDPELPRVTWTTKGMNLFPGVPHLAFFQTVLAKFITGTSIFDTCGGKVIPTERQIEIFSEGEFDAVTSIPSYLVYWMRTAVEMVKAGKVKKMPHFKGVAVGGEPVTDKLREYFKELARELGAHPRFLVLESMGMTETKWAFTECYEKQKVHLNPKFYYWEVVDKDTLKPVGDDEEGVLVFSHIGWRGTVFVRYFTGDLIRGGVVWGQCPYCKYTYPRLIGPIMRAQKDFTKIKGTRVALLDLVASVRDTDGVRSFQIILDKEIPGDEFSRDVLKVRVSIEQGYDERQVESNIKENVKKTTEVTPDVVIFEKDDEKFKEELFARTGVKAEHIVENRPVHI